MELSSLFTAVLLDTSLGSNTGLVPAIVANLPSVHDWYCFVVTLFGGVPASRSITIRLQLPPAATAPMQLPLTTVFSALGGPASTG